MLIKEYGVEPSLDGSPLLAEPSDRAGRAHHLW